MGIPKGWTRILLIALNALNVIWGAFVFLVFLKLDVLGWLILNVCSPSQVVAIIGLWKKDRRITGFSIPLLLTFGFGGLFAFSWSGYMLQAQLNHLLMTLTALYMVREALKSKEKNAANELAAGIVLGIMIAVLLQNVWFPYYFANAPESVMELLGEMGYTGR